MKQTDIFDVQRGKCDKIPAWAEGDEGSHMKGHEGSCEFWARFAIGGWGSLRTVGTGSGAERELAAAPGNWSRGGYNEREGSACKVLSDTHRDRDIRSDVCPQAYSQPHGIEMGHDGGRYKARESTGGQDRDRESERDVHSKRGCGRDKQCTRTQRPSIQFSIELNKQISRISDTRELCDFVSTHASEFNHVATAFRQIL